MAIQGWVLMTKREAQLLKALKIAKERIEEMVAFRKSTGVETPWSDEVLAYIGRVVGSE